MAGLEVQIQDAQILRRETYFLYVEGRKMQCDEVVEILTPPSPLEVIEHGENPRPKRNHQAGVLAFFLGERLVDLC